MATSRYSARTDAIKTQRAKSTALLKFSRGRRVLSISSKTNSIANNVQAAEDKDVTNRYGDGEVSNQDYLAYLEGMLKRPGISYSDKVQVENTIRDTNSKIGAEQLEADYDTQPDNSMAKAAAADRVATYWKEKSDSLVPGTPAHSIAMQKYGDWTNKYQANYTSAGRTERALDRAQQEMEISAMDLTKGDSAMQAAKMYQQLAQDAATDGDQLQASQFMTKANNLIDTANAASATEGRKDVLKEVAMIRNDWHDGTIDYATAIQRLTDVENYAIETGDANIQNTVNTMVDKIYKDNEKGVNRGLAGGLPVVKGRGGGSGSASVMNPKSNKTWEEEDEDYTNQMMDIDWKIKTGQINAEDGRGQQYILMMERTSQIDSRVQQLSTVGWGAKIPYQGDNVDAGDLRKEFVGEYTADASKPFLTKGVSPDFLKNNGLGVLMQNDVPQLVSTKVAALADSGADVTSMTPEEIFNALDLDLQGKTGVAYIQTFDENNQPAYKIVSTQNNPNFIPGTTHVYDGAIWHEVQTANKEFSTEDAAKAYYQSIFGTAPSKDELKQQDNGWWKVSTPEFVTVDGQNWERTADGWKPVDPELDKTFNEIKITGMGDFPINDENKSFTVLKLNKLDSLKQQIQTVREQNVLTNINKQETTNPYEQKLALAGEQNKAVFGAPKTGIMPASGGRPTDQSGRELSLRERYSLKNPPLENVGQNLKTSMEMVNPSLKNMIQLPPLPGGGKMQSYESPLGLEQKPSDEFVNSIIKEGQQSVGRKLEPINLPSNVSFNLPNQISAFQPSNAPMTSGLSNISQKTSNTPDLGGIDLSKLNLSGVANQNSGFTTVAQPSQAVTQQAKPNIFKSIGQWLQPTLTKAKKTIKGWFS